MIRSQEFIVITARMIHIRCMKQKTSDVLLMLSEYLEPNEPEFFCEATHAIMLLLTIIWLQESRKAYNMHFSIDICIILRRYRCDTYMIPA